MAWYVYGRGDCLLHSPGKVKVFGVSSSRERLLLLQAGSQVKVRCGWASKEWVSKIGLMTSAAQERTRGTWGASVQSITRM